MSIPDWLWWTWVAAFVLLEAIGLWDNRPGGTLSELVWKTLKVRDRRPTALTWIARGLLSALGVLVTGHLAFGWSPW